MQRKHNKGRYQSSRPGRPWQSPQGRKFRVKSFQYKTCLDLLYSLIYTSIWTRVNTISSQKAFTEAWIILCIYRYICAEEKKPSKHAGSDSEELWLWPVMAVLASMQPELGRTVYPGSNFPLTVQFHSSKEGLDCIVQIQPRSDLDGLGRVFPKLIWSRSKPVCKNHWAPTSFQLLDSVAFFNNNNNNNHNNNKGHFYSTWSLAWSKTQCVIQKAAEKCINTNTMDKIKKFQAIRPPNHTRIYIQQFQ